MGASRGVPPGTSHGSIAGHPPFRIGVNLSSIQFFKQNVPLLVAKVLAETGLEPWLLDLELTESIVMHNAEAVAKDLQQLRDLGVSISIDDFGTRYSTLTYVKHFPVDRLKIDQCFVRDIATNPSDAAIVRAIVSLGHSLDLEIVAEGVETIEQATLLRAEGCDEVQGFYFAAPMQSEELIAFVQRKSHASAHGVKRKMRADLFRNVILPWPIQKHVAKAAEGAADAIATMPHLDLSSRGRPDQSEVIAKILESAGHRATIVERQRNRARRTRRAKI